MCMLCDDEKAYQAYMDYLDAMARKGAPADPDRAMDAALDAVMLSAKVEDNALSTHYVSGAAPAPQNPFSCDPVDE